MSARVIYGLADRGHLPSVLAQVNVTTRTPVTATILVVVLVLILALAAPLEALAETTARVTLVIFALVNAALVALKQRGSGSVDGFRVPVVVPIAGTVLCAGLLLASFRV